MTELNFDEITSRIKSDSFDCFLCLYQISVHRNNIGVQHHLVSKLKTYPYSTLEFYVPQLIQILVSYESDSMALHDFIREMSRDHPHFCLLAFWNLQAYVFELRSEPASYSFHVVRSFLNGIQEIMFDNSESSGKDLGMRENLHPALMMSAAIAASVGLPKIHDYAFPLIASQGRQQKSLLFKLANFHKTLTKNLTMKNSGPHLDLGLPQLADGEDITQRKHSSLQRYSESNVSSARKISQESIPADSGSDHEDLHYNSDYSSNQVTKSIHLKSAANHVVMRPQRSLKGAENLLPPLSHASRSMPELVRSARGLSFEETSLAYDSDASSISLASVDIELSRRKPKKPISVESGTKLLLINYYRKETEFMMNLQNISSRLSQVPKEARLSSLRAELSIINNSLLPSQIDIPQLLPSSRIPHKKFNRILKLNVNEAGVLNSAERVPYLLLVEYLSDDMDFDPLTEKNQTLMADFTGKKSGLRPVVPTKGLHDTTEILENEADLGDLSVVALSNEQAHFQNHLRLRMSDDVSGSEPPITRGIPIEKQISNLEESHSGVGNGIANSVSAKDLSTQVRIAAVMLRQLEKSGQANSEQSVAIKSRILDSMKALQDKFESIDYQQIQEISAVHGLGVGQDAGERKIENDFKIGEDWATKRARIRRTSPYGHLANWDLCSVIVKNGDDLQQEAFACQLIALVSGFWAKDSVGVWTKNMKIVVTSFNSGLVQTINNALSLHSIKKTMTEMSIRNGENPKGVVVSIKDYFGKIYGHESSQKYMKAQKNFAKSLAAYSILCYVLQIKDRHNGNIMIDHEGHIIHIDFGFILSNSPGSVGFEAAPFKLTSEYVDVLGGQGSKFYDLFVNLCKGCFKSLRENYELLVDLVELMQKDSSLPCFKNGPQTSILLKQRLQLHLGAEECDEFVENALIGKSLGSMYTRLYDQFQLLTQGIYT